MSPCYFELVTELALLFAKHGDGVLARGRALASLHGYGDTDSAADVVLTETRVLVADTNNLPHILLQYRMQPSEAFSSSLLSTRCIVHCKSASGTPQIL